MKNSINSELKEERRSAAKIFDILTNEYPEVKPALEFGTPLQLLIATILSAQCTDARVNIVTKDLFKKYRKPEDYLNAEPGELEKDIYSTGFYKMKAKNIRNCCRMLIEEYNGKVPEDFNELNKLPGVGRKTAAVVAGNAFGIPAVAVDTHVVRLSNLLGFVDTKNAEKIERKLMELLPPDRWINSTHYLMAHGRAVCIARRPKCHICVLANLCPSFNK